MSARNDEGAPRSGFDRLARPYRWLEYLSFGPLLWWTRTRFLPHAHTARRALVLGDGDGRFTVALLRVNPAVHVCAVDASSLMLRQLQRRAASQGNAARVEVSHRDATRELPPGPFDLVCTHFFLDCLNDPQCEALIGQLSHRVSPGCLWIVSEFAIPEGPLRTPARLLICVLYGAFRMLTGLQVRQLPEYGNALRAADWDCTHRRESLKGILRSELWQKQAPGAHPIHHEL